jgi:hypothetical protein
MQSPSKYKYYYNTAVLYGIALSAYSYGFKGMEYTNDLDH